MSSRIMKVEDYDNLTARLAASEARAKMLVEALREIVEDVEFSKKHSDDLGRQNTLTFILDGARAALLKAEEL